MDFVEIVLLLLLRRLPPVLPPVLPPHSSDLCDAAHDDGADLPVALAPAVQAVQPSTLA